MADNSKMQQVMKIADILMGAAHSDGRFDAGEKAAIMLIMKKIMNWGEVPQEIIKRIEQFDAASFDLEKTVASLNISHPQERRMLLKLISDVIEADDLHDFNETEYIKRVATYIGAPPEEYEHLIVDLELELEED